MDPKRGIAALNSERANLVRRMQASNADAAKVLAGVQLDWYRIRNEADDDTSEVLIYESIGGWFGIPASEFVQELNGITSANINVRINSPGGSVFDSIAIYNALVKHPANINIYVDSLAASGASVISMAGDRVVMMVGSQMMIHDASGIEMGNAQMMREMADFLDKQSDNIASIYAARTGGDPVELRNMMLAETWMLAQEAVDLGFADEIYSAPSEKDKPMPPGEEDEPSEEDGEEIEPEEDEDAEALMHRRHALAALGYKYAGRRKAPAPKGTATVRNTTTTVTDDELDSIISAWADYKGV